MFWIGMLVISIALLALTVVWIIATNQADEVMRKLEDDLMRETFEFLRKRANDETSN